MSGTKCTAPNVAPNVLQKCSRVNSAHGLIKSLTLRFPAEAGTPAIVEAKLIGGLGFS